MAVAEAHSQTVIRAMPRISEPPPSCDEDPLSSRLRREVGRAAVSFSRTMADALGAYASLHGPFESLNARVTIGALDDALASLRSLERAVLELRTRLAERIEPSQKVG